MGGGEVPWPPTIEKFEMGAATLKDGNYSAAESYLSQYRVSSEQQGHIITGPSQ